MRKSERLTRLGEDAYQSLVNRGGYIKGYGEQFRVMDSDHNPIFNIPKDDIGLLINESVFERKEMVFILSDDHALNYQKIKNRKL